MYGILLVDQFPVSNKEWRALQNEYFEEFMGSKLPECYIPRPPHAVSTYSRSVLIDPASFSAQFNHRVQVALSQNRTTVGIRNDDKIRTQN